MRTMRKLMLGVCLLSGVLLFGCGKDDLFTNNNFENLTQQAEERVEIQNKVEVEVPVGTPEFVYAHKLMESFKETYESQIDGGFVEYRIHDKGITSDGYEWDQVTIFCEITDYNILTLAKQPNNKKAMDTLETITIVYYELIREKLDENTPLTGLHMETYDGGHTHYTHYSDCEVMTNFLTYK